MPLGGDAWIGILVGLRLTGLRPELEAEEVRDGDGRQDPDDGDHDHQLDEGEAAFAVLKLSHGS